MDAAATSALKIYNPLSIITDVEWAGSICRIARWRYSYSLAVPGDQNNSYESECPDGTEKVAIYHAHGQLIYESVTNGTTTSDYLIRSTVLGSVLTKLEANGSKNTTYMPTNGLVTAVQQRDSQGHPTVRLVQRDASGLQEDGQAYDPFGNIVSNTQPPVTGPPPYVPFYGATWGGASWSSFVNANNFSTGCYSADNNSPAPCNSAAQRFNQDFWSNLPGYHGDLGDAEHNYDVHAGIALGHPNKLDESGRPIFHHPQSGNLDDSEEPQNPQVDFTAQQLERFKTCVQQYGVTYLGHSFTVPGSNPRDDSSYFYGHTDAARGWIDRRAIGDFTARTDQASYTTSDLRYKADRAGLGIAAGKIIVGYTDLKHPYVNAIAADAGFTGGLRGSEFIGLWVYEVGNALSAITGQAPPIPPDARDRYDRLSEPGAALEDCVFGGRLNSNGSVTPPR